MSGPEKYGNYYWKVVSKKYGEIFLHADTAVVDSAGTLVFSNEKFVLFSISSGNWDYFFAASMLDGGAVSVEHWWKKSKEAV